MLGQILKYLWCNAKLSITHGLPAQLITEPVIHGLGNALSYQVLDIQRNGFTSSHLEEDGPKIQTALGEKIRNFVNNLWSLTIKDGVNITFKTASSFYSNWFKMLLQCNLKFRIKDIFLMILPPADIWMLVLRTHFGKLVEVGPDFLQSADGW